MVEVVKDGVTVGGVKAVAKVAKAVAVAARAAALAARRGTEWSAFPFLCPTSVQIAGSGNTYR